MAELEPERKVDADVNFWLEEIKAAKKREKDYRKDGKKILAIYDGEKAKTTPFNILFSNTETMLPALYSAVPRPVVQRRFKDDDPLGKHASLAGRRGLEFLLDTNLDGYDTFDAGMKHVALDACLPGRGIARVKYDNTMGAYPAKEGEEPAPYVESELICIEAQHWDRVLHGYAKKWHKVPWVAYEHYLDNDEASKKFGQEIADKLKYSETDDTEETDEPRTKEERSRGEKRMACVYEVWDKDNWGRQGEKKILWVSPNYKDGYLKVSDDELGLSGFFNCPKPIQFIDKTHSLVPTALYTIYENQAEELNKIQRRINRLVEACKARGIYAGDASDDFSKLFSADENELVPAGNNALLGAEKGLDKLIFFMPLDQIRQVLMDLYNARESCKQVIYEITGLSDILRGASKASETLGEQEIKTQWGTLRLKNKQKEVARFARDLLRMMLELAAKKLSPETWAKMTGLPFLLDAKFNELTTLKQTITQQLIAMQVPSPQPGQPPQHPLIAQLQQIEQALQAPKWSDVLAVLQNDLVRAYRIDIETNSTVEPEAAEDHKHIQEMMMTLGQVLQGLTPLVTSGTMPFQMVQDLLLVIARRYRFGNEIEDHIKSMQPPKPPDENGAEQVKKEKEFAQKEIQMKQKEAEGAIKSKDLDHQMNVKQREMQLKMKEMEVQMREIQAQHEKGLAALELKMQEQMAGKNIQMKAQDATFKVKQAQQQSKQSQQQRRTA
jgi:hypothetical protein